MNPAECEFEADVLLYVMQSRWPDGVEPQIREHVAGCRICSEVAAVASAIGEAREAEPPAVPDSGRVWWLAQLRARREAARTAGRPITVVQVLAFACAMGLVGACFGATSEWFRFELEQARVAMAEIALTPHVCVAISVAAVVFVVPAAVYLASRKD